ncbi:Flavin prenyltransferase UbiX [invertebrate metagenome]|uniref:flavin prenyltransferase n=1 Tax=invertebrate metagenome TaxID=1711999 RepID=A0A2H9TB41_9ZZZZ
MSLTSGRTIPNKEAVVLAITGASGVPYGLRLLEALVMARQQVFLMISDAARDVLAIEMDMTLPESKEVAIHFLSESVRATEGQIRLLGNREWTAPVASGSGCWNRMVICPCSMGTLSAISCGASNNLIERAADVALKERRLLVLVPREMPLSAIHLENMLKLSRMGSVIMPASPGFYQQPKTVDDMVNFVVARILKQLGIDSSWMTVWGQ